MTTLVACIDRSGDVPSDVSLPVTGWDAVESLVTDVGLADPENSRVNTLLEGLRVARDLEADGDDAVVAVLGDRGDGVSADRSVARQADELVERFEPDSAVVVVDSAEDERLVPIVESRIRVDAVDRVVVRQARDIESTYYLLKQFLADEELRKTVLVPLGVALIAVPVLLLVGSPAFAIGTITAAVGGFLIYKGLGIDEYLARLPGEIQEALYSGQVSLVTYVVAAGLALVGLFVGALAAGGAEDGGAFILAMEFAFESVPWLTAAALAAATGRLLDELIRREGVRTAYVNLPFGAVALGLVVRGFSGFFLERAYEDFGPLTLGRLGFGIVPVQAVTIDQGQRLALFILLSIVVSILGVRTAAYFSESSVGSELAK